MATIRRSRTVKAPTENGSPSRIETTPGHAVDQRRPHAQAELRDVRAWPATARRAPDLARSARPAHRRRRAAPRPGRAPRAAPRSRRRARRRGTRRRPRAACSRSASGTACSPRTRRRARLASCRAASGERSTIGAISSNGTANMSCSTNASRSAGVSVSSTTSSASPTESASSASCSGSVPSARSHDRVGQVHVERLLAARPCASAACSARPARRRSSASRRGSRPRRVGAAEPQPGLLDGVVGLAQRAEHPVGHRPQVRCGAPRSAPPASRAHPSGHIPSSRGVIQLNPRAHGDVTSHRCPPRPGSGVALAPPAVRIARDERRRVDMSDGTAYVLGSDDAEIARLDGQAASIAGATDALLRAAGIGGSMRVLDLGTGLGHVALWWPACSMPAARWWASTRRSGCSRSRSSGARPPASRTSGSCGRTRARSGRRAVRRDRRPPAPVPPARPCGGPGASARGAAARAARWSWSSSTSAPRAPSRRSRSSRPCGAGSRRRSGRRAPIRASARGPGSCCGAPGSRTSRRSGSRPTSRPRIRSGRCCAPASRGRWRRRSSRRASPARRSWDSTRCRRGSPSRWSLRTRSILPPAVVGAWGTRPSGARVA